MSRRTWWRVKMRNGTSLRIRAEEYDVWGGWIVFFNTHPSKEQNVARVVASDVLHIRRVRWFGW
jgi:hypothetical protein